MGTDRGRHGRISLEGLRNTRDLGGYETRDGRRIVMRRLIRSGALYQARGRDLEILKQDYSVDTVVDFRTETEQRQNPDPVIAGVRHISLPILKEQAVGITFEAEEREGRSRDLLSGFLEHAKSLNGNPLQYIEGLYRSLVLDPYAQRQYGRFFDILLEAEGAVLWHCTAGKDRAGLGTAFLLLALGVDRQTVLQDFSVTNEYLKEDTERLIETIRARCADPETLECARVLNGVAESYLSGAFAVVEGEYGTVEQYLGGCLGLGQEKRGRLKEKYLEKCWGEAE